MYAPIDLLGANKTGKTRKGLSRELPARARGHNGVLRAAIWESDPALEPEEGSLQDMPAALGCMCSDRLASLESCGDVPPWPLVVGGRGPGQWNS